MMIIIDKGVILAPKEGLGVISKTKSGLAWSRKLRLTTIGDPPR
jgi:hypothetical protein